MRFLIFIKAICQKGIRYAVAEDTVARHFSQMLHKMAARRQYVNSDILRKNALGFTIEQFHFEVARRTRRKASCYIL